MSRFVLDASVAIAWYLPERFSPAARVYRDRLAEGRIRLLVPGLHFLEVANVLRTQVKAGALDAALAREIFALHLEADLEVVEPALARPLELALEWDITVYDATYVALALDQEAPLLTAERPTRPWIARLGERAISIS